MSALSGLTPSLPFRVLTSLSRPDGRDYCISVLQTFFDHPTRKPDLTVGAITVRPFGPRNHCSFWFPDLTVGAIRLRRFAPTANSNHKSEDARIFTLHQRLPFLSWRENT
jgi:hypothetical protein